MLRNKILRVFYYFWFQGTELRVGSLPLNGLEQNSKCLLLFLFHRTEFRVVFSSAEWFGTEFREFPVPRNSRNFAGTNQLFRLFNLPRNNFLSEIANLIVEGYGKWLEGKNISLRKGWKGGAHRDAEREIRNKNKVQERGR
jgi:hypothetical protein